jgi:hypothetical protein
MSKTAEELTEQLSELLEQIQEKTVAETRADCADALRDNFIDRSQSPIHYRDTPTDAIIGMLREAKSLNRRAFAGLADRFDNEGVSLDFRLGIQFAVALLKDPEFEL